jgi:hypothetical protein
MGNVSTTPSPICPCCGEAPHLSDAELVVVLNALLDEQAGYVRTIVRRLMNDTDGNKSLRKEGMDALVHYLAYVEAQHPNSLTDRVLYFVYSAMPAEDWSKDKDFTGKFITMSKAHKIVDRDADSKSASHLGRTRA